jgi:hypothetical protein
LLRAIQGHKSIGKLPAVLPVLAHVLCNKLKITKMHTCMVLLP